MSTIVNLNKARKRKARAEKERQAAANRVRHGRTKAEKQRQAVEDEAAERRLDGHRLDSDVGNDDSV